MVLVIIMLLMARFLQIALLRYYDFNYNQYGRMYSCAKIMGFVSVIKHFCVWLLVWS